jgi:hypothetical protein
LFDRVDEFCTLVCNRLVQKEVVRFCFDRFGLIHILYILFLVPSNDISCPKQKPITSVKLRGPIGAKHRIPFSWTTMFQERMILKEPDSLQEREAHSVCIPKQNLNPLLAIKLSRKDREKLPRLSGIKLPVIRREDSRIGLLVGL